VNRSLHGLHLARLSLLMGCHVTRKRVRRTIRAGVWRVIAASTAAQGCPPAKHPAARALERTSQTGSRP
jgi:hypothetical protein